VDALNAPTKKQSNNRRLLIYFIAFLVYCGLVLIVSLISPILSIMLDMPVVLVAVVSIFFGSLWYFLVQLRDNPDQAGMLFFAVLLGFVGLRASSVGYMAGKMRRGRPPNPSLATPKKILRFGFTCMAFGAGTALIVGILFGRWKPAVLDKERFPQPGAGFQQRQLQPPMQPPMRPPMGPMHRPVDPHRPDWARDPRPNQ
jgi:hypothetical protein